MNHNVSGSITLVHYYQGGAAPPKFILDQYPKYIPMANTQFYLRKGSINELAAPIFQSITTNAQGEFTTSLPPGVYSLVFENKKVYREPKYAKGDHAKQQYQAWLKQPEYVLEVKEDIKDLKLNIRPSRDPTLPLPP